MEKRRRYYFEILQNTFVVKLGQYSLSTWVFLSWLLFLTLIPYCLLFILSFSQKNIHLYDLHFTFNNYLRCFDLLYFKIFIKTIWVSFVSTLCCFALGFPSAYYLARSTSALKQIGLILLFVPFWTNFILRVWGLMTVWGNNGFVNQMLMNFHITSQPIVILHLRLGVYLGLVYNYLPLLIVPIYSALEKVDINIDEAAFDLGANRIQTFRYVIWPQIKNGVYIGLGFVFIPMLGEYVIPDLLGGARESFLGNVLVNQFFVAEDWPFGSAIALILTLCLLFPLYIKNKEDQKINPSL